MANGNRRGDDDDDDNGDHVDPEPIAEAVYLGKIDVPGGDEIVAAAGVGPRLVLVSKRGRAWLMQQTDAVQE